MSAHNKIDIKAINKLNLELVIKQDFDALLDNNRWYIYKVANSFHNSEYFKDLFQEGLIGLYVAMLKFDTTKKVPFIGYAQYHIRGKMLEFLNLKTRTIKVPRWITKEKPIQKEYWEEDNTDRIIPKAVILEVSMEELIPQANEEKEDFTNLHLAINSLFKPKDRKILQMYFGLYPFDEKYTTVQIAEEYNKTPQSISLKIRESIKKLANCKQLESYKPYANK